MTDTMAIWDFLEIEYPRFVKSGSCRAPGRSTPHSSGLFVVGSEWPPPTEKCPSLQSLLSHVHFPLCICLSMLHHHGCFPFTLEAARLCIRHCLPFIRFPNPAYI